MKLRVQREDGTVDTVEFLSGDWRVLDLGDVTYFVGGTMTHVFTADGYYDSSKSG